MLARERQSGLRRIHVDGPARPSRQSRDGKGARVGKEVEHGPAAGERAEAGAVVTLVQEKSGFLTARDVGEKAEAVFDERREGKLGFRSPDFGFTRVARGTCLTNDQRGGREDLADRGLDLRATSP